ncbi:hypothetical protein [Streptococcus moroccensis]|uniref:Quinolinate synthase n=1 Tax=Streptococcus moroccensis TaxID=1451356 RepID=A0ABT9YV57_9STRE|nr:hypothetical protein [Streptococcus moroccensis]MDQ0222980.1 quinolinate synthase [Streptococcus moroccensis]
MNYSRYVVSIPKDENTFLFNTKNNLAIKIENRLFKKIENDIFNERTFNEKCQRMQQNILQNFELAILSNKINYELKVE